MVLLKYLLVFLVVLLGFTNLRLSLVSLKRPFVYQKDFIQEYLLVQAVVNDVDPYLPLPELAARFLEPLPNPVLQHPTPHPPAVALLSLPLALLDYRKAAAAWLVFEIVCYIVAVYWLLRWFDIRPGLALVLFSAFVILGWSPLGVELITGQLMMALLLLLIGAWLALRDGDEILGGFLLGLTIALKLIAWPIVIFLAFRRKWRAILVTVVITAVANLAAGMLMGLDRVFHFYLKVGGPVSALYHAYEDNFSTWTVGWRVFEGTGSSVVKGISAPPLVQSLGLARIVSIGLPLVVLTIGLLLAIRARSFDTAFGILVCVSILISPVAWRHYLVLSLIPLAIIIQSLVTRNWPKRVTNLSLGLALLLFIPRSSLDSIILALSGNDPAHVPFSVALLSYIPAVTLLGLIALLWHLDRSEEPARQSRFAASL
jgi:hypothetical protein